MSPELISHPSVALAKAVSELWRLTPPGPTNLLSAPEFISLRDICQTVYGASKSRDALSIALHDVVLACGLPCRIAPHNASVSLPADLAAVRIHTAFLATHCNRIHLCPLDLAGELPELRFGPNSIQKFSTAELEALIEPYQSRIGDKSKFDVLKFSEFNWLTVRERISFHGDPGERALPVLFMNFGEDFGRIDPHSERFPGSVESALFAVLLAPWEEWTYMARVDWRAFRIPWIYTVSDDIVTRQPFSPSPDTLSWEPQVYVDVNGEDVEVEKPSCFQLHDAVSGAGDWLNDATWTSLSLARKSPLFETPIAHFFVRAFSTEGIDSFLAHITVVEAALGLKVPHETKNRRLVDGNNPGATFRIATRLAGLLGTSTDGDDFRRLFSMRSEYVHGRPMSPILTPDRLLARRLARRTVEALVKAALTASAIPSRDAYLDNLLDKGLSLSSGSRRTY